MACGELRERRLRAGVMHAAARDDERAARGLEPLRGLGEPLAIRPRPLDVVHALREEASGIVEGLGLHVLRQRERRRAAIGRVEQHGDRLRQRGEELLGPRDAVPEPRHGPQAIVGRDRRVAEVLDLLQHRVGLAAREGVAREQQHRQAVRVRERGGRHEVGGARARPRSCRPSCGGDCSPSRTRWRHAPSPARCARGKSAAPCGGPRAPRPCPRRCRGRRSRTRRGRAAARPPACGCAARRDTAPGPGPSSGGSSSCAPHAAAAAGRGSGARPRSCARSRRRCARWRSRRRCCPRTSPGPARRRSCGRSRSRGTPDGVRRPRRIAPPGPRWHRGRAAARRGRAGRGRRRRPRFRATLRQAATRASTRPGRRPRW